jgi:O-acetyl-ADP-ribose deacetylase (regulator of RNase III)
LKVQKSQHAPDVDAVAIEDDTYFVLGADPEFREPTEHPLRIWNALHHTDPAPLGSVTVVERRPLELHAVVHDLSADPTWTEAAVADALRGILREVGRRGCRSLALPVLGAVHGRLPPDRFVALLTDALEADRPAGLESVWLIPGRIAPDDLERRLDRS